MLYCIENGKALEDLSLDELHSFSPLFDDDIYEQIDVKTCICAKKSFGSTSYESVKQQIAAIEACAEAAGTTTPANAENAAAAVGTVAQTDAQAESEQPAAHASLHMQSIH